MSIMSRRILVIGGLAAGPSAASKAARVNPDAEVVLFEQGEDVSYGICEIPYYIGGEVQEPDLVAYTPERLQEKKGIDVRTLHRVERILPAQRVVVVRNLRTGVVAEERYDRLILALGSTPRTPGWPGEKARNVFTVKSLQDGLHIRKFIDKEQPATAVIVGGGYIGMEMADTLARRGLAVTVLHRYSLPLHGLERKTRERIRHELEQHNVQFVGTADTQGFVKGSDQRVSHVATAEGSFKSDIVILAMGVEPNTALARECGVRLGLREGIVTDQRQQTSIDTIFAAGDCCEAKNLVNNRPMYIPLATIASKAGWVAGENAAGGSAILRGAIRAIAVRIFDIEVAHIGLSSEEAAASGFDVVTETISAWSKAAVMPSSSKITITTIADKRSGRLLGVNTFGKEGAVLRANTFAVAVQHKLTLSDIQQWDLAYSPPFTPLWDPILIAANVTRKKM
jgi:CoA-dependent NAD(P)H sulfur oxidoreductase